MVCDFWVCVPEHCHRRSEILQAILRNVSSQDSPQLMINVVKKTVFVLQSIMLCHDYAEICITISPCRSQDSRHMPQPSSPVSRFKLISFLCSEFLYLASVDAALSCFTAWFTVAMFVCFVTHIVFVDSTPLHTKRSTDEGESSLCPF